MSDTPRCHAAFKSQQHRGLDTVSCLGETSLLAMQLERENAALRAELAELERKFKQSPMWDTLAIIQTRNNWEERATKAEAGNAALRASHAAIYLALGNLIESDHTKWPEAIKTLCAKNAALRAALTKISLPVCGCWPVCRCDDSIQALSMWKEWVIELARAALGEEVKP